MAENSAIEWTDHTFNPWEGCQKVGPGCDHCYAETRNARFGGGTAPNWGPNAPRRLTSKSNWQKPLRWQADAAAFLATHGRRQRVFCASLADVFDNAVPDQWRSALFDTIHRTPDLDWMLLTKRIGNVAKLTDVEWGTEDWPANVWLGATIVNQDEADRDIPKLLATRGPRVRFLSMEPLLGPVNLEPWLAPDKVCQGCDDGDGFGNRCASDRIPRSEQCPWNRAVHIVDEHGPFSADGLPASITSAVQTLDWVIVGGESGPGARPMHPDWARSLRDQCAAAGVPLLFKQWGEWAPGESAVTTIHRRVVQTADWFDEGWVFDDMPGDFELHADDEPTLYRAGKKEAGRLLDGVQHDGVPA